MRGLAVVMLVSLVSACGAANQGRLEMFAVPGQQLASLSPAAVPAGFRAVVAAEGITRPAGLAADGLDGLWLIDAGHRLVRIGADGRVDTVAEGAAGTLWTGVAAGRSVAFVTGSGPEGGSQLLSIDPSGRTLVLLDLPPGREAPLLAPVIGPDRRIFFATTTLGARHQIKRPCQDAADKKGHVPCDGAVFSLGQDGGSPQLVAWGLRAPRGLGFTPDGHLFALDGDRLWAVAPGVWYGWPDQVPQPNPPPRPLARFSQAFQATALALGGGAVFGGPNQAYVALSSPSGGYRVVRVDLATGVAEDFARFPGGSQVVAMQFSGDALFILDDVGTLWRIAADLPIG